MSIVSIIAVLLLIGGLVAIILGVKLRKNAVAYGGGAPVLGSGLLANELRSFLDDASKKGEGQSANRTIFIGVVLCIIGVLILMFS